MGDLYRSERGAPVRNRCLIPMLSLQRLRRHGTIWWQTCLRLVTCLSSILSKIIFRLAFRASDVWATYVRKADYFRMHEMSGMRRKRPFAFGACPSHGQFSSGSCLVPLGFNTDTP